MTNSTGNGFKRHGHGGPEAEPIFDEKARALVTQGGDLPVAAAPVAQNDTNKGKKDG